MCQELRRQIHGGSVADGPPQRLLERRLVNQMAFILGECRIWPPRTPLVWHHPAVANTEVRAPVTSLLVPKSAFLGGSTLGFRFKSFAARGTMVF